MVSIENSMQREEARICFMDDVRTCFMGVSGLMIQPFNLLKFLDGQTGNPDLGLIHSGSVSITSI
jgi:hypothetical protein